jgi:pimeloyl-ACP methyl ester carboxylesterase
MAGSPNHVAAATSLVRHGAGFIADPVPVYYERIEPPQPTGKPTVMMIHGGSHSGGCYLHTADGRPGWAYAFAAAGHPVVVPDWPGCGRSGALPPERITGELVCRGLGSLLATLPAPVVLLTHSMGGVYGWRLLEAHAGRVGAVVAVAPGMPGNIQPVPEVLSESDDEIEVRTPQRVVRMNKRVATPADADFVGRKLVGDSRHFPRERLPAYAASLLATPSRLLYERQNTRGSQLRVEDTARLAGKPILVVTGTDDLDHPREVDGALAEWLAGCGAAADFRFLGDEGIAGNGHMLMLEDNSDAVAALILRWLDGRVTAG